MATGKTLRSCGNGHRYYKSSDCPACPACETQRAPQSGFLALVAAPARRALERAGIATLIELSKRTESELLKLHGMGPSSMPKLQSALTAAGLSFRSE